MTRLIDADALLEMVDKERQYLIARGQTGAEHILVHNFRDLIDNAPTVEITEEQAIDKLHDTGWLLRHDKEMTERPTGHWIEHYDNSDGFTWLTCSRCMFKAYEEDYNFCPNCGAEMRKEEEK